LIYIIDSSFCAAVVLKDEKNDFVDSFFDKLDLNDSLFTTNLFWYEMSNIIRNATIRKRIINENVPHIFNNIFAFNIETDHDYGKLYSLRLYEIGKSYNLTTYDASYLELAVRKGGILASLDEDLLAAAKKAGVPIFRDATTGGAL
jgi:predicted nucleic acid-binding protein